MTTPTQPTTYTKKEIELIVQNFPQFGALSLPADELEYERKDFALLYPSKVLTLLMGTPEEVAEVRAEFADQVRVMAELNAINNFAERMEYHHPTGIFTDVNNVYEGLKFIEPTE